MSRIFTVTVPSPTVVLDKNRAAVPVTVSNTGTRPVRGRARLVPLGGTPATWLNLAGEAELDFATNQTRQFQVVIAVPEGAAAGQYSFRLDVASVANPDDDVTEGPVVSFAVVASEPAKKPFPIWILVAAAAVLLIVGGALAFVFWPRPSELKADFAASPVSGAGPLTVQFDDKSEGGAASWDWTFGDGQSAIEKSSKHVYKELGDFTVAMRVRDARGQEKMVRRENYIRVVLAKPNALAPRTHPIPADLIVPDNGGGILKLSTKVRFKWEAVPLVSSYKVEVQFSHPETGRWTAYRTVDVPAGETTTIVELGLVRDWHWRLHALSGVTGVPDTQSDWLEFGGKK